MLPSILEIAMYKRPTVGGSSAVLNNLVEFVRAVCLEDASKAFENPLRIDGSFGFRVIVEDVGATGVAAVHSNESPVCLSEPFSDHRKSGGIRLNNAIFQEQQAHPFHNGGKNVGKPFRPAAHGRTVYGNTHGCKNLLLALQRQVQPEIVSCNLGQQSRAGQPFNNGLVGLLSSDHLTATALAGVLERDVLDAFVNSPDELNLVRDSEANNLSWWSTARAKDFVGIKPMPDLARFKRGGMEQIVHHHAFWRGQRAHEFSWHPARRRFDCE